MLAENKKWEQLLATEFFDFVHHWFIENPGVPHWWPGFCLAFNVIVGVCLAVRLKRVPSLSFKSQTG